MLREVCFLKFENICCNLLLLIRTLSVIASLLAEWALPTLPAPMCNIKWHRRLSVCVQQTLFACLSLFLSHSLSFQLPTPPIHLAFDSIDDVLVYHFLTQRLPRFAALAALHIHTHKHKRTHTHTHRHANITHTNNTYTHTTHKHNSQKP